MIRTKKTVIGLEIHLETQNYGCISGYILLFKTGLHGQPLLFYSEGLLHLYLLHL